MAKETSNIFGLKNIVITVLIGIIAFQYRLYTNLTKKQRFSASVASSINLSGDVDGDGNNEIGVNKKLVEHTKLFNKKEVIKVNDQVYVGIGYGLANSIIIEGETSYIVVDTLESIEGAREFREDFNKLYNNSENTEYKLVSHIIFTHYHADHTQGTTAFYDDMDNPPIIISHSLTKHGLHRVNSVTNSIVYTRAMRQFGTLTREYDDIKNKEKSEENNEKNETNRLHINSGIGPYLMVGDKWDKSILLPTKTLNDDYTQLEIDGVILDIYYAPGETDDQIFIYLPQTGTLLPADNIYETFPNLYAIRGSPTRDASKWVQSLDTMRYLYRRNDKWMNDPKNSDNIKQNKGYLGYINYMVPCHTRPVFGSEKIYNLLTVYRDGIEYIHDQTVRYINRGITPNEMIPIIKSSMPLRLKEHPWLFEFYGTFDWSIRGVFNSYLGWFSGDAADLFPLSKANSGKYLIQFFNTFEKDFNSNLNTDTNTDSNTDSKNKQAAIIDFLIEMAQNTIVKHKTMDDCQWGLDVATNIMSLRDDVTYNSEIETTENNVKNSENRITLTDDEYERSKEVRINGLKCLAGYQISANGRNYYLTSALENSGNFKIKPSPYTVDKTIMNINLDFLFDSMTVRYKIDEIPINFINSTFCYIFDITNDKLDRPDLINVLKNEKNKEKEAAGAQATKEETKEKKKEEDKVYSWYKIELRDGIIEVIKGGDLERKESSKLGWLLDKNECINDASTVITMTSDIYREVVAGTRRNEALLYAQGDIRILKGSILNLRTFATFFERE